MKTCERREEVALAVRAGQWPRGCGQELLEHVAGCARCTEEAYLLSAFAKAREVAMCSAAPQSPGVLWWRAQLRRKHAAMETLGRPASAIATATIMASIILLLAVLATEWKRVDWSRLAAAFSPASWNVWMVASVATLFCGFAAVAVMLGVGASQERR